MSHPASVLSVNPFSTYANAEHIPFFSTDWVGKFYFGAEYREQGYLIAEKELRGPVERLVVGKVVWRRELREDKERIRGIRDGEKMGVTDPRKV